MKKEIKLGYLSFMIPNYLYIPFDDKSSLKIFKNKNIYCGSLLGNNLNASNIYSSASGTAMGVKSMMTTKGLSNVLILENDFKDKRQSLIGVKKDITNFKKRETNEILELYNLNRVFTNKKYLLINVSYNKNSDISNIFLINENVNKLLEVADALATIYDLKKVIFVLNKKDSLSHEALSRYIGSYLNININEEAKVYKDSELSKSLFGKKSEECVVYSVFELYEVYNILKGNKYTSEKFITIFGNKIERKVIYTKIGVSIEELLTVLRLKTVAKEVFLITSESEINIERNEAVITKDVKSIKIN